MTSWVLSFHRSQAVEAAKLRALGAGRVRLGVVGNLLWARYDGGPAETDETERILSLVPACELYELLDGGRLREPGRLVPTKRLPSVTWSPLETELETHLPRTAVGEPLGTEAAWEGHARVRLVRLRAGSASSADGEAESMLLGTLRDLKSFADGAPEHRLSRLRFAVNDAHEVLVLGAPLPSMPGERYTVRDAVAVPVGLTWAPAVAPGVLRAWLGLDAGGAGAAETILLIRRDERVSEIPEALFAPLRRASLRERPS